MMIWKSVRFSTIFVVFHSCILLLLLLMRLPHPIPPQNIINILNILRDQIARLLHQRQWQPHLAHGPVHKIVQHLEGSIGFLKEDIGAHFLDAAGGVVSCEDAEVVAFFAAGIVIVNVIVNVIDIAAVIDIDVVVVIGQGLENGGPITVEKEVENGARTGDEADGKAMDGIPLNDALEDFIVESFVVGGDEVIQIVIAIFLAGIRIIERSCAAVIIIIINNININSIIAGLLWLQWIRLPSLVLILILLILLLLRMMMNLLCIRLGGRRIRI